MNTRGSNIRSLCFGVLACCIAGMASSAIAAKPGPSVSSDVSITFAGVTFELLGAQTSFSETQDGGRIAFNLTTVGTSDYLPLPEIDTESLPQTGNRWEVVSKLGSHTYTFAGTCASQTFSAVDAGGDIVRHLFLNCRDISSNYTP